VVSKLADELESWGRGIVERLRSEVGELYPLIEIPNSAPVAKQSTLFGGDVSRTGECEPVAYIWARTVPCKRPGCAAVVPLVRKSWLRKKGGQIAAVPKPKNNGHIVEWEIKTTASGKAECDDDESEQTGSGESCCPVCTTPVSAEYVKECARAGRLSETLAAVIVDGGRSKLYLPPEVAVPPCETDLWLRAKSIMAKAGIADFVEPMNTKDSTTVAGRGYGISRWDQLFTGRQFVVLVSLVKQIREAHREMLAGGMDEEFARAETCFLGISFGRLLNSFNKFCRWSGKDQCTLPAIGDRQALKMVYDFPETNPFADTAGNLPKAFANEVYCIRKLATVENVTTVTRGSAEHLPYEDGMFDAVVTDPPYYGSIFYADLSYFFYVWLRRVVGDLFPEHFASVSPPRRREAVAQPSQHEGDTERADEHYRKIMQNTFAEIRRVLKPGAPLVCVYAHKTTEGWASLIKALVLAGLTVTEAWPLQTEARGRANAINAAALSDSIFLIARRRESNTTGNYETEVHPALERIARERIKTLWANGKGIGGPTC
jgi:putative DNA methylase